MRKQLSRYTSTWLRVLLKLTLISLCLLPFMIGLMVNFAKAQDNTRAPASLVPSDHVYMTPIEEEVWMNTVFVEDEKGVLKEMVHNFETWQEKERYAEQWNLESTGLYQTPTQAQKKSYLSKRALKYLDKRISGEVKNAKKGSTLHKIGQAQKTLKPETDVNFSPNMRLSFKSRVLDGEVIMVFVNPYFDNSTKLNYKGDFTVDLAKKFETLDLSTRLNVNIVDNEWEFHCDRPLFGKWNGRVTARKTEAYDNEQIVRVAYSHRF
jgi:ABC-type glycerol-3-phosphate transport system permease component